MFKIHSKYKPAGDQPVAINQLVKGLKDGKEKQVLLGATGTGKTFTIANVIERVQKPTLVIAHNKTLAGQLYLELKSLFPNNHVEYFVSYYDYYQPEAYIPSSDTYIEKDSAINDEIDELRHSATSALIENKDVIVVASVSCIYGLGDKEEYIKKMLTLKINQKIDRKNIIEQLVEMLYERNDFDLVRGTFRAKGDTIEIIPSYQRNNGIKIELFGNVIEKISEFNVLTGEILKLKKIVSIFPASHYVTNNEKLQTSIKRIRKELKEQVKKFEIEGKLLEKQRLEQRVKYDLEILQETGFCSGIENYSRHLALKEEGETPTCLIDFFPQDYLLIIDESHAMLPQIRAMYNGDRARKSVLVDYGFRLPSALDNRPLKNSEFQEKINQVIYVSATPGDEELEKVNNKIVQQIIRPTGLLDPTIDVRPSKNQIDDLINEINKQIKKGHRTLITTLTKRMSEELTKYLKNINIKVAYLHSDIKTLERMRIIKDLRKGIYDAVVGINLLREGIDIPEVSLVVILDADKQGFLRSGRSLVQTIGRCARNSDGRVIMYADKISEAMEYAISETKRRRSIQEKHNKKNNIIPATIEKEIVDDISSTIEISSNETKVKRSKASIEKIKRELEKDMQQAAKDLDFERAVEIRDILFELNIN